MSSIGTGVSILWCFSLIDGREDEMEVMTSVWEDQEGGEMGEGVHKEK